MAKEKASTEEKVETPVTQEETVQETTETVAETTDTEKSQKSTEKEEAPKAEVEVEEAAPIEEKVEAVKEAPKPEKKEKKPAQEEEFDWEAFETKGFGEGYSQKERDEMAAVYEDTLTTIEEKELVQGVVVGINSRDVILNIGFKSDGLVPMTEFRDMPDLKVGDAVEVFIDEQENANGQLVLSRRK
ncbi:MAG: S1 RNA-binding domain-containing protein, partial [Bacteroidota bacterium]